MNAESHIEAPRYISAQKMERLSAWAKRKPVIALMGEFSSGKSTLMNLLVGQSILPTQVTATRLPPVWFQYGDKPAFWMDKNGQRHPVDLDNLGSVPLDGTRFIRIYLIADQLKKCDLIDTPGISDPNIPTESWIKTIGYANSVVWCTHAGQAWRESERSQWENLPDRLQENSLLLVTRADKIISRIDLDKIHRRLLRETNDLFYKHHFMSLTMALKSREEGGDVSLWEKSGGAVFINNLEVILGAILTERNALLRRYRIVTDNIKTTAVKDVSSAIAQNPLPDEVEKPAEAIDNNVSVLRPRRVQSSGSARNAARLNSDDAANIRDNLLSNPAPNEQEDLPADAATPIAQDADQHSADRTPNDGVEAPFLQAETEQAAPTASEPQQTPTEAVNEPEQLRNEVGSADDPANTATDNKPDAASDDTAEPGYYRIKPAPETPIEALSEDEAEESFDEEPDLEISEADPVTDAPSDENADPLQTAPQQGNVTDETQTPSEVLDEEGALDEEPVIKTEVLAEATDTAEEAPLGNRPAPNYSGEKSASEIWQEIIATSEIETVPEMLEAVSLLLEQLEEKRVGFRAA